MNCFKFEKHNEHTSFRDVHLMITCICVPEPQPGGILVPGTRTVQPSMNRVFRDPNCPQAYIFDAVV